MPESSLATFVRMLCDPRTSSSLRGTDLRAHRTAIDEFLASAFREQMGDALRAAERRRQLRLQRCVAVDLPGSTSGRGVTLDVGMGGFSAVVAPPPPANSPVTARLRLNHRDAVAGNVAVVGVTTRRGSSRVSFRFTKLADADRDRLELFILRQLVVRSHESSEL